jgi:hypothetical protein
MNNPDILLQKEPVAKYGNTTEGSDGDMNEGIESNRSGTYEIALNGNGFTLLLFASSPSSNLSLYDAGIHWQGENAPTISAGIDFQKAASGKKYISAKEAGRLALLHLEEAEARRRQYAEDLARFQAESEESGEKAALNKKRITAKEARRLVLLDLEEAEARRRRYADELARFQMERLEIGD